MPSLTADRIPELTASAWPSRHATMTAPYFQEYLPLLNSRTGDGVKNARAAFCLDRYFIHPAQANRPLQCYIAGLCAAAAAQQRRPVLKFVRSQGRLPWFRHHFPEQLHILLVRQPWAQFSSGWHCLSADDNSYFLAMPFVALERNWAVPAVAALARALALPLAHEKPPPLNRHIETWMQAVRSLPYQTWYRGFFAFWLLNLATALPAANLILDSDAPRGRLLAKLAAHTGISLDPGRQRRPNKPPLVFNPARPRLHLAEVRDCHRRTLDAATDIGETVKASLGKWIRAAERDAARRL